MHPRLSFLVFNFFFIEPRYTLTIAEPHELLALSIFLIVAVTASALAGRVREQAQIARHAFAQRGGCTSSRAGYRGWRRSMRSLKAPPARSMRVWHGRRSCYWNKDGDLVLTAAWPPEDSLDTASLSAARWAFSHNEPAGADTATLPTVPWLFVPLVTARGPIGVVGDYCAEIGKANRL